MRYTLTFAEQQYEELMLHLFNGDDRRERAAYLLCGISTTASETRLLVRHSIPVPEPVVLSSSETHISIPAESFLPVLKAADEQSACFVFVHSHPEHVPDHSAQDDREEPGLFRTAYNRIASKNAIHASLVFSGPDRPRGRVWLDGGGTADVDLVRVIGSRFRFHHRANGEPIDTSYHDRQVRAFGTDMHTQLSRLTIGVIGAGGTGSAVIEQLIRLGVGRILVADGQQLAKSNVSRVYGSGVSDVGAFKVRLTEELSKRIGLGTQIEVIERPITYQSVMKQFRDVDIIFGCTDDQWGRAILGRFSLEYCIPVLDLGVKIDSADGTIRSVVGRVTTLTPSSACLFCRGQITPEGVAAEILAELSPDEAATRRREGYIPELPNEEPSVIPFTSATSALAISELLHRLTGFRGDDNAIGELLIRFDHAAIQTPGPSRIPDCWCSNVSLIGRGDRARFLDQTWRPE
ncbi:ThiF family adenylyltransferase [Paludibaculum fermentans]|uniref:ThiF family adenylyltransferase n=1 Tax=Paludibaculum fermentans TaxID=1473598 RepID=UPI003EB8E515